MQQDKRELMMLAEKCGVQIKVVKLKNHYYQLVCNNKEDYTNVVFLKYNSVAIKFNEELDLI